MPSINNGVYKCPRCGEEIEITQDGVNHASNKNGTHWIKYSISDLNSIKDYENKMSDKFNKFMYGQNS